MKTADEMPTKDINVIFPGGKRVDAHEDISLIIKAPRGFPDKYRSAFVRTANLCTVKKHIVNPPKFEIMFDDQSR